MAKETIIEKQSKRRAAAIRYCVDRGEYSPGYALDMRLEPLHDAGKILDADYEPLADYLWELIEGPVEDEEEPTEYTDETSEEE